MMSAMSEIIERKIRNILTVHVNCYELHKRPSALSTNLEAQHPRILHTLGTDLIEYIIIVHVSF